MRISLHVEGDTMEDVLGQLRAIIPIVEHAAQYDEEPPTVEYTVEPVEYAEKQADAPVVDFGKMKDEALALLQKAFTTNRAGVQAIQKRFGVKKFADVPVEKAAELLREAKAL